MLAKVYSWKYVEKKLHKNYMLGISLETVFLLPVLSKAAAPDEPAATAPAATLQLPVVVLGPQVIRQVLLTDELLVTVRCSVHGMGFFPPCAMAQCVFMFCFSPKVFSQSGHW